MLPDLFSALLMQKKADVEAILTPYFQTFKRNHSAVLVRGATFKSQDFWLAFYGDIELGEGYVPLPRGVVSMTTNDLESALDYVRVNNVIQDMPKQQHRMLQRILSLNKELYSINLGINKGEVLINGAPSGRAPSFTELLNLNIPQEAK